MTFRDREKQRLVPLKPLIIQTDPSVLGTYKGNKYDFAITNPDENLYDGIRAGALSYFKQRAIQWHDGHDGHPSTHLCCSQSSCVNSFCPFASAPKELGEVLRRLGYAVEEMLPMDADAQGGGAPPYVSFEWIGLENYLNETSFGEVVPAYRRARGKGFTSADFAFRFRREDGKIQVVLGEWKYTEEYAYDQNIQVAESGTDRLSIYGPFIWLADSPVHLSPMRAQVLFYEPFYQLMRLQLLASAMEKAREMDADEVTVLHVAPRANSELVDRITSPGIVHLGGTVHDVWARIVEKPKFKGIYAEDLLAHMLLNAPDSGWAQYMHTRYYPMR